MYGYQKEEKVFNMKEVAEILNMKGYGRTNLFKLLREAGVLFGNNSPKQEFVDKGYFLSAKAPIKANGRILGVSHSCRVKASGVSFIKLLLTDNELLNFYKSKALEVRNSNLI